MATRSSTISIVGRVAACSSAPPSTEQSGSTTTLSTTSLSSGNRRRRLVSLRSVSCAASFSHQLGPFGASSTSRSLSFSMCARYLGSVHTHRFPQCPWLRRFFRHHLLPHNLRFSVDLPPSGFLWAGHVHAHVPLPHQGRDFGPCRQQHDFGMSMFMSPFLC